MKTKIFTLLALCIAFSVGTVKAQTELITNPGFEDASAAGMLTVTESSLTVLQRANGTWDANSSITYPTATATVIGGKWVKKASSNDEFKAEVVATGAHGGANCINLRINANATTAIANATTWSNTIIQQKLAAGLDVTKRYKASFWAKTDATCAVKVATFFLTDGTNKTLFTKGVYLGGLTTWTQYTVFFDLPAWKAIYTTARFDLASYAGIGIYTTTGTNVTNASGITIDDVSLTEDSSSPITRYVTVTGNGGKTGLDWENAAQGNVTANIQTQINDVSNNLRKGEIRFGAGNYNLTATLALKDGVNLTGAYPVVPVTTTNEARDLVANKTIFDGGNARKLMNAADDVAYNNITVLDGLIIQRGNASYGSAMGLIYGFVMQNCIIRNNTYNSSSSSGGAVLVNKSSFNISGTPITTGSAFVNCVFANNSTNKGPSALLINGNASSTILNCVFANNKTTDATALKIRNTNSIGCYGAVYLNQGSSAQRVVNSVFYQNVATNRADRHLAYNYDYMSGLYNNYFDGSAAWRDSMMLTSGNYAAALQTASYYRNFSTQNNKCNADFVASSIFVAPNAIAGSSPTTQADIDVINATDWRLKAGSGCIDAGISSTSADITYPYSVMLGANRAYSTITSDLGGITRTNGANPDMGAYEYTPITVTTATSDALKGSVSASVTAQKGTSVTVVATPLTGFRLLNWTDAASTVLSTSTSYTFTAAADIALTANFEVTPQCTITTATSNVLRGSVTASSTVYDGAAVTVVATPESGYTFINWTDGTSAVVSTTASYTFNASANVTLTANFAVTGPIVRYVTKNGAGNNDGTSWANAAVGSATSIQGLIDEVFTVFNRGEIRFGAGTYALSEGVASGLSCLTLKDGASLIGAYPANPVTGSNDTRDLLNNQTIFDGSDTRKLMTAPDGTGIVYSHITLLDGLILQRGNSGYGSAAALCYGFVMQNCIIRNNKYSGTGGAGGAVYVYRNSFNPGGANPTTTGGAFINCVFANNSTTKGASALLLSGNANSTITNCVFANNVTTDESNIKIRNTDNFGRFGAVNIGGANGLFRVVNNIFYQNYGTNRVDRHLNDQYNYFGALYNNYFDGSAAWRDSVALTLYDFNTPVLESGGYYRNFTTNGNKCNSDFAASTIFAAPNAILGSATSQEEIDAINNTDWRLKAGSGCIGAGISTSTADITYPYSIMLGSNRAYSTITTDLSGTARITGTVDMGAYEYGVGASGNTVTIANGAAIGSSLTLDGTKDVVVNKGGILSIDAATTLNSLTINAGGRVTLASGQTLAPGTLALHSSTNGTATYVDNNIYTVETPAPAVTATVEQHLTSGRNWYVASPISNGSTGNLSTATSVVSYNESTATWIPESAALNPLKGYISVTTNATSEVSFAGTLNNGPLSVTVTRTATLPNLSANPSPGFNLVGNPYPSFLDWNLATKTNLESTVWFRTKTSEVSPVYTFDTYNATNNLGTNNNLGGAVTRFIPPMQAFWVRVASNQTTGTFGVDNTMRSHEAGTNRLKSKAENNLGQQVLRLKVSNSVNSDEAIVLFNPNASNGFDAYDSPKMSNANPAIPEIFTKVGAESLVINGLNSLSTNSELPLGFTTGTLNDFSIKATEVSNFDANTHVILKDNVLKTEFDITDGTPYAFSSPVVNDASRFTLVFRTNSITTGLINGGNESENGLLSMYVYKNANNKLVINSEKTVGQEGTVSVCNSLGQKLVSTHTAGTITVLDTPFATGVYYVTVSVAGKSATKKVIIN